MQIAIIAAILQTVASQTPLPLPANPAVDCGLDVTRQWSRDYPQCMQSILGNGVIYNEPLVDPGIYGLSVPDMKADNMTYLVDIVQTEVLLIADVQCCAGTQKYFGSESTLPSRNCFCDPDVYARFMSGTTMVDVATAFGIC